MSKFRFLELCGLPLSKLEDKYNLENAFLIYRIVSSYYADLELYMNGKKILKTLNTSSSKVVKGTFESMRRNTKLVSVKFYFDEVPDLRTSSLAEFEIILHQKELDPYIELTSLGAFIHGRDYDLRKLLLKDEFKKEIFGECIKYMKESWEQLNKDVRPQEYPYICYAGTSNKESPVYLV